MKRSGEIIDAYTTGSHSITKRPNFTEAAEQQAEKPQLKGITIRNYRAIGKGCLVGSFSVGLPSGMVINKVLLFEKNGNRWISLPNEKYEDKNGGTAYSPMVTFSTPKIADKFRNEVIAALKADHIQEDKQEISDDDIPF